MGAIAAPPPVRARSPHFEWFNATMTVAASSIVNLAVADKGSLDVCPTQAMTRQCDSDVLYLAVSYQGTHRIVLGRDSVALLPRDMVLLRSSVPMESRCDPGVGRPCHAVVPVDAATLPGGEQRLRCLVNRPLSSQDGMVSLVAQHLYLLGTGRIHPEDAGQFLALTSSLLSLMLARRMAMEPSVPSKARTEALYARVQSYILHHLSDPSLDAGTVAAAHHISTRTLHRLFQNHGLTIAAWIRRARLDRCRAELLDPAFADRTVQVITRRWGFTHHAQFSRLYRAAYGESPSATRTRTRPSAQ
jgi:AraC-like DNA-binding protein